MDKIVTTYFIDDAIKGSRYSHMQVIIYKYLK